MPDTAHAQPSNEALAAWRSFLVTHARVTEVLEHELMVDCKLPLTWYDVLVVLSEAEDNRLRMHDLAERVLLSRAGLTRLVDRMTSAGLVQRVPCAEDRRGLYVVLTPHGQDALEMAAPLHLAAVRRHFTSHLTAKQLASVKDALDTVLAAVAKEPRPVNRKL
jgi:DNA-binding MarR family transcriptional regulator